MIKNIEVLLSLIRSSYLLRNLLFKRFNKVLIIIKRIHRLWFFIVLAYHYNTNITKNVGNYNVVGGWSIPFLIGRGNIYHCLSFFFLSHSMFLSYYGSSIISSYPYIALIKFSYFWSNWLSLLMVLCVKVFMC